MDPIKQITSFNLGSSGLISVLGTDSTQQTEVARLQQYLYVATKLDTALLPEIRNGDWDLVVISGNAGDGKSAFLLQLRDGEIARDGRPILVNRDATHSDSPDETQTDRLMRDFIGFSDSSTQHRPDVVQVIAMNTGMLVSFFDEVKNRRSSASSVTLNTVECLLKTQLGISSRRQCPETSWRILLVDLNHRSVVNCETLVVDEFPESDTSLFSRLVEKIADHNAPMWERCRSQCPTDPRMCYVRQNVALLHNPQVRQRLHLLLGFVHLRGERHLSVRDLLSLLSYLIAGHYSYYEGYDDYCERVVSLVRDEAVGELLGRLLYNVIFADRSVFADELIKLNPQLIQDTYGEGDELVEALNALDFAALVGQGIDAQASRLFYDQEHSLAQGKPGLEATAFGLLANSLRWYGERITEAAAEGHSQHERALRQEARVFKLCIYRILKRRSYFLDAYSVADLTTAFPHLAQFLAIIKQVKQLSRGELSKRDRALVNREVEKLGSLVTRAILKSDRVKEAANEVKEGRAVQLRLHAGLAQMSFNAIAKQSVALEALLDGGPYRGAEPFIEHSPTTVSLRFKRTDGSELGRLEIDARLFEFLHRIDQGYLPCSMDLQRFVHLQTFKDQLRRQLSDEIDSVTLSDPQGTEIVRVQRKIIRSAPFYELDVVTGSQP